MNAKVFISIPMAVMTAATLQAQRPEATDSLTRQLQEVVVTAKQPATKLVGSTLVSTIAGSNLANLGNALDVLAQLPMITVQDNTVCVVGKDNVEIYIDNRPVRDGQELQQLLSSSLKKVELQMAPGAAYESTTGAVLKISTKRNFVQGLSLTDQLQINRRCKWSATDHLGLNYRAGDWDLFLNGTINHDNSVVKGNTTNTLLYKGNKTVIGGRQHNSYPITAGTTKVGFNYAKNSRMLGAYYRYT